MEFRQTSAEDLHASVLLVVADDREGLVTFLKLIDEIDRRKEYEYRGQSSIFGYCANWLRMSRGESWLRTQAMFVTRSFPQAYDYLRDGRLTMTTLLAIRPALEKFGSGEASRILDDASGMSKAEAKRFGVSMVTDIVPVERIREAQAASVHRVDPGTVALRIDAERRAAGLPPRDPAEPLPDMYIVQDPPKREDIEPVSKNHSDMTITVDQEFLDMLAELGIAWNEKDKVEVLRRAMRHALKKVHKRKPSVRKDVAAPTPPVPVPPRKKGKKKKRARRPHIPDDVYSAVWLRAGGRCEWKLLGGERCGSDVDCQLDHIDPLAKGGETDPDNLRVVCRKHNLEAEEKAFGKEVVERYTKKGKKKKKKGGLH